MDEKNNQNKTICLVSGLINLEKYENHNRKLNFDFYRDRGQEFIDLEIPKIIFMENENISKFTLNKFTSIIPFEKNELFLHEYLDKCLSGELIIPPTDNILKDTALFHFIQLQKTEWVSRAIDSKLVNCDIYCWMDFGISKIFTSKETFIQLVNNIPKSTKICSNKITIPGCWNPGFNYIIPNPELVMWFFCGGFWCGDVCTIKKFNELCKNEIIKIIEKEKKIVYEVNLWYYVCKNNSY